MTAPSADERNGKQELRRETEQLRARLALLNAILKGIASGQPFQQILGDTIPQIHGYFPDVRVGYASVDDTAIQKVVTSVEPFGMPPLAGAVTDLKLSPEYLVSLRNDCPVIVADLGRDRRFAPGREPAGARAVLH